MYVYLHDLVATRPVVTCRSTHSASDTTLLILLGAEGDRMFSEMGPQLLNQLSKQL